MLVAGELLKSGADVAVKNQHYTDVITGIKAMLQDQLNWVAAAATVSSVLHHAFEYFHWTGFYCVWPESPPETLIIGPYQGKPGCLHIAFSRGVCGAAARSQKTQLVPDVHAFPGHIACAASTRSEVVVPLVCPVSKSTMAVLDIDSDLPAAFDTVDVQHLEELCSWLAAKYSTAQLPDASKLQQ